jgi:hypothetical protein
MTLRDLPDFLTTGFFKIEVMFPVYSEGDFFGSFKNMRFPLSFPAKLFLKGVVLP